MEVSEWAAYVVAGVSLLVAGRVLWSTRGAKVKELNELLERSRGTLKEQMQDKDRFRENELKLREANRKLREALELERKRADEKEDEAKRLNRALGAARMANEKLNEVLGNQEEHVKRLEKDIAMLRDQVTQLRAQLGMEP